MPTSATATTNYPTNFPTRYYDERSDGTPCGFYTDHADHTVQQFAYIDRTLMVPMREIAERLGLAHWHWAQRAIEQHCRRNNLEMPRAHTRPNARRTARNVGGMRRFGIEIEFNRGSGYAEDMRQAIVDSAQAAGFSARVENYNHDVRTWWKMTSDATVTGGEFVSPIMGEDDAAINEACQMVRFVKQHGGVTGRNVGMHVHHNVTDFDRSQMGSLVRNLRDVEQAMIAFVPSHRTNGTQSYGANRISDHGWMMLAEYVESGRLLPEYASRSLANRVSGCPVGRYSSFNFNSVLTYGTVEFRLLGHTLNTAKIASWIKVGQAIVRMSKLGIEFNGTTGPQAMCDRLVADGGLAPAAARRFMQEIVRRNPALAA